MEQTIFSPMELDAIGEIMNISLGSSATAVSNMLDHRVDITTPAVSVVPVEEFSLGDLEPAIAIEIKYVSGLEGSNIMLLKRNDVKVIVDILMGTTTSDEEFELNELTISAVCEVMNQLMGAASTALSDFLGRSVNISTPQSFTLDDLQQFKEEHFNRDMGPLVVARFTLGIENMLKSEFLNVMSLGLARELLAGFGMDISAMEESAPAPEPVPQPSSGGDSGGGGKLSQEEIERLMGGMGAGTAPEPTPEPAPAADSGGGGKLSQEEIERLMGGMGGGAAPEPAPAPAPSGGGKLSQEEIERLMGGMGGGAAPEPAPAPAADSGSGGGKLSQEEIERLMGGMAGGGEAQSTPQPAPQAPQPQAAAPQAAPQGMPEAGTYPYPPYPPYPYPPQYGQYPPPYQQPPQYAQPAQPPQPKVINTQPVQLPALDVAAQIGEEQAQNLELIMSVPLEVSVEIGRTRRKVEDILTFSKGSLVVLDKLAGDQVDLFVNGLCVARGDVVVIDDNFGVRITEVLKRPGLQELAQGKKA